jgi:hypothetical protein
VTYYQKQLPLLITGILIVTLIFTYFVDIPGSSLYTDELTAWAALVGAFAIALIGPFNLIRYHAGIISKREPDKWLLSVYTIAITIITYAVGVFISPIGASTTLQDMYNTLLVPCSATIYSLTGFFIASAAYRTFQFRNMETSIMLLAGVLIMMKNAAVGGVIWPGFPIIGDWIMKIPNTGGFRGIMLATTVGLIAYGVRLILGFEKVHAGGT